MGRAAGLKANRRLLRQGPRGLEDIELLLTDPWAGHQHPGTPGRPICDYQPDQSLFSIGQNGIRPWHTLPKKWPDFARSTYIASGGSYKPFDPFDYQIELVRLTRLYQNVLVLKSRQVGVSETIASDMLCSAIRKPAWTGIVFSKTGDDAGELAARIKGQASSLRERCPPLPRDSMRKLVFDGAGSLHFLPPTERAARGIPSASKILYDESAHIEKLEGIETGAGPTLSMLGSRGRSIWVTTPNGRSGKFYQHWEEDHGEVVIDPTPMGRNGIPRLRGTPDFTWCKVCIHYSQHPLYGADPNFAATTKRARQLTDARFNQEYELDFTASDFEIFKHELIQAAEAAGMLEIPQRGHVYVLGVDPNGGGNDQFSGIVVDVTSSPWRTVAGFAEANCSRDYGLRRCAQLMDEYQPALTAIEKNGVGAAVAESLGILRPGFELLEIATSEPSKVRMTDRIVLLLEQHEIIIPPDWFLGRELRSFRQNERGRREAAPGRHDDAVMALAMACEAGAQVRPMDSGWITML